MEGDKSSQEYVQDTLDNTQGSFIVVGGASSETQFRMDWGAAGLEVLEPPIKEVESGIDRVTQLMKQDRFRVFRSLSGLRDELGSYRRKLDERGEPTEEILNKRIYHRCFIAGTLVSTINGDVPIEQLKAGDLVLTRQGYKPITQYHTSKAIVRPFIFSNGKMLVATPDHPVYVKSIGYIELRALRYCDIIETSYEYERMFQWQRSLNLMAKNIIVILNRRTNQTGDIIATREITFIERCGNIIMARFQKAIISIIKTATRLIMTSQILNVLVRKIMQFIMYLNESMNSSKQWITLECLLRNGMDRQRDENGIGNLVSYLGKMQSQLNWYVKIATRNLKLWLNMATLNFALMPVSPLIVENLELITKQDNAYPAVMNLEQISTVKLDIALDDAPELVEVYNLTVETNEYFANGILAHNCDALRYAASYINDAMGEIVPVVLGNW